MQHLHQPILPTESLTFLRASLRSVKINQKYHQQFKMDKDQKEEGQKQGQPKREQPRIYKNEDYKVLS